MISLLLLVDTVIDRHSLAGHHVVQVSCGAHHMAVVTLEGCVFCWGDSTQGQCGVVGRVSQPQQVYITHTPETALPCDGVANTPVRAMQVGCGDHHTMALSDKGELWTWGTGDALGLGNPGIVLRPCLVNYLVGRRVISVVCGAQHTLALVAKAQRLGAQKGGYHIEQHSQAPATCARCKGDIYTYTESGDECVISDHHTCPLGLELYPRAVVPCDSGVTECNPDNMGKTLYYTTYTHITYTYSPNYVMCFKMVITQHRVDIIRTAEN